MVETKLRAQVKFEKKLLFVKLNLWKDKMPKSKRDRKIALSKTQKKIGLETKQVRPLLEYIF